MPDRLLLLPWIRQTFVVLRNAACKSGIDMPGPCHGDALVISADLRPYRRRHDGI